MTTTRTLGQIVADMVTAVLNDGAGTVPVVVGVGVPTTGYAVALDNGVIAEPHTNRLDAMIDFVRTYTPWAAATPGAYFGVWTDTDDGRVYIDRVIVKHELATALDMGAQENQIAIWDFAQGTEIRL